MKNDANEQMQRIQDYFEYINKKNKAREYFFNFIETLKNRNSRSLSNATLENTVVVKAINLLLSTHSSEFCKDVPNDTVLYRARIVDFEQLKKEDLGIAYVDKNTFKGFDMYNSKEPPLGFSPDGRNNFAGASYLYLAEDAITAVSEVNPAPQSVISVATFKTKKNLHIVDFNTDASIKELLDFENDYQISASRLITLIMQQYSMPISSKEKYYATQYITDLVRKMGYDGIKYRSNKTNGFNVTLFNCHNSYIEFVESKLVYCDAVVSYVYDVNDNECITRQPRIFTQQNFDNLKSDLCRAINYVDSERQHHKNQDASANAK